MSRLAVWFGFECFALVALSTSPGFAQRELKDIPDPDPEIERKSFIVADGFEVNLFAADPLLHKPIQMNFDPQGRLWIAASEIYPQIAPGQKANDKILVLEDTDGDGKADESRVVLSGFGTEDTHHIRAVPGEPGGVSPRTSRVTLGRPRADAHRLANS